jgi:hypothetical protein
MADHYNFSRGTGKNAWLRAQGRASNNMVIQAVFTGTDGSMGYRKGELYSLKVAGSHGVAVQRLDGTGKCPYQSLSAFLANWSDVKVLER